jgi:intracellular sulfur oxidation DsrE/DsrF family protein
MKTNRWLFIIVLLLAGNMALAADSNAPWGHASTSEINYKPHKVVYDVSTYSMAAFSNVLDRVSYLNTLYQADPFDSSIILVLHGDEIPYFAIENYNKHQELMTRAQSLENSGNIEFRMCKLAAQAHGYKPGDIHGFVEMVPMADAEIIRLQREQDHAYMQ